MISFDELVTLEDDLVLIKTVGKYDFSELFGFLERVKAKAGEVGRDHILIDSRRLEGQMTEAERFPGGQKIAEVFGSRFKVALLMPADGITKLGELAAVNRGARFLVTASEDDALEWLSGSESARPVS